MRSELFRIPTEVGGVPLFGFGLLLLLWLATAGLSLWLLSRRGASSAELWSYAPVILLVAVGLVVLPRMFPEGLPVRGYGVMLLVGATTGLALASHRARQQGIDPELIYSLAFWMFIFGILGARLFYVIEYWPEKFAHENLLESFIEASKFAQGGLVVYGSLIGGGLAFIWFVRRKRLPMLAMADLIAPSLVVGLAFGRLGCLLNGCCYGGLSDVPWAVTFPQESPPYMDQVQRGLMYGVALAMDEQGQVMISYAAPDVAAAEPRIQRGTRVERVQGLSVTSADQLAEVVAQSYLRGRPLQLSLAGDQEVVLTHETPRARSLPVHPAQVYSAINAGLLGWFLWSYYPYRRREGEVTALMLTIYPVARFLEEVIRIDEASVFGTGLSISQNLSILIFALALGLWGYLARQGRHRELPLRVA